MNTLEGIARLALQRFGHGAYPGDGVHPGDVEAIRDEPRGRVAAERDGAVPSPKGLPGLADLMLHTGSSPTNVRVRFEVTAALSERERTGLGPGELELGETEEFGSLRATLTREALQACPHPREAVTVLRLSPECQPR